MEQLERIPRGDLILDSVKAIFAAKGFDGASMQDLARAAGMSAGNFYRYFPSKAALIEALVEREIECVRAVFAEVIAADDPLATFSALARERIAGKHLDHGRLWIEIEAAAARRPEFGALVGRMEAELTRNMIAVFARISGLSAEESEVRFGGEARLLLMLVHSVSMRCGAQRADPELAAVVVRVIDHTLSEIAEAGRQALRSARC